MIETISLILLIGIPAAIVAWFVYSLVKFIRTPKENKNEYRSRQMMLLASGFILGSFVFAIIAVMVFFGMAIKYM